MPVHKPVKQPADGGQVLLLCGYRSRVVGGVLTHHPRRDALQLHAARFAPGEELADRALIGNSGVPVRQALPAEPWPAETPLRVRLAPNDGSLKPEAGKLAWPFGEPGEGWSQEPQDLIDNAFVYACRSGEIEAAERLLQHGARINAIPPGFSYAGTGLHFAAMEGHRPMVEYLLGRGADPRLKDQKVRSTPAGWAAHGGHPEIAALLERAEKAA